MSDNMSEPSGNDNPVLSNANCSIAPYTSGCELLINSVGPNCDHSSPLQQICRAFQHASEYFSVTYLDERRGYGAIAKVDIPKHTLILDEPPLLGCDPLHIALEEHEAGRLASHDDDTTFLRNYFNGLYKELKVCDEVKETEVQTLIDLFWHMHDQYAFESDGELVF